MQIPSIKYIFSISNIVFINAIFIWANITYSNPDALQQYFPQQYTFICSDPYNFFLSMGINLEDDIIKLPSHHHLKKNRIGVSNGVIYQDSQQTIYIKDSDPFIELMASRLMNLFVGTTCSPIVKTVRDANYSIASLHLPNFQTNKSFLKAHKKSNIHVKGKALLAIAQALLGVVDQNNYNLGVVKNGNTYHAARVDLDTSFDYTSKLKGNYSLTTNHLNLKQLYLAIKRYPKNEIVSAIKTVTDVPDEKIIMTIFQAWATICQTGFPLSIQPCLTLANEVIERKNAFRRAIENKKSKAYKLLERKHSKKKSKH